MNLFKWPFIKGFGMVCFRNLVEALLKAIPSSSYQPFNNLFQGFLNTFKVCFESCFALYFEALSMPFKAHLKCTVKGLSMVYYGSVIGCSNSL